MARSGSVKPDSPTINSVGKERSFLVFGAPCIEEAEIDEVVHSLRSGWLGTGPKVAQFEKDFCSFKGGWGYPIAVNSCTAALHIAALAAGLKPGDEVITTALTFCATINALIHAGLKPVLADVDPLTMNIDAKDAARKITPRTRGLVPVHFAGRPCDMDRLTALAAQHGLKMIEDCAHAIESTYHGRPVGTFGNFGCFSFYVTKNIVTGEGGMVLAKREEQAARCKILALHGMSKDAWQRFGDRGYKHYEVVECGFKYNMMDIQAAIGLHQLKRIEGYWARRQSIWAQYDKAFGGTCLRLPQAPEPNTRHAFHLYTVQVDESRAGISRDAFLEAMTELGIGVGVHYRSIPEHPFYEEMFGWKPEDFPAAMTIGRQTVSLPLSAKLTDGDVQRVIEAVLEILGS